MYPAGFIPPEFREIVKVDLRDSDREVVRGAVQIVEFDDEGNPLPARPITDSEMDDQNIQRNTGVRDLRNGEYHPNRYFED